VFVVWVGERGQRSLGYNGKVILFPVTHFSTFIDVVELFFIFGFNCLLTCEAVARFNKRIA
jgi:hypothetical protein